MLDKASVKFNPTVITESLVMIFCVYFTFLELCSSPCVSGVCTAQDKCSCDRGYEGSNCDQTSTAGTGSDN